MKWLNSILSFLVAAVIMVVLTIPAMRLAGKSVITRESAKDMIERDHALRRRSWWPSSSPLFAVTILASHVVS